MSFVTSNPMPTLYLEGPAFYGPDKRKYETLESFTQKSIRLGYLLCNAIEFDEIPLPTALVTLPRGSWLVADVVARMLGFEGHEAVSRGISSYKGTQQKSFNFGQPLSAEDIEGEDLLIVDEVADSSKTLRQVAAEALDKGAKSVTTGVVDFKREASNGFVPDIYVEEVGNIWVVYPREPLDNWGKAFRASMLARQQVGDV
jgi:hypoxanthine phosphoribosyltransferase